MLYSSLLQTAVVKLGERLSAYTIYLLLPFLSLGENASSSKVIGQAALEKCLQHNCTRESFEQDYVPDGNRGDA